MLIYSQRDPRWASHPLGWGPKLGTIGQYGCLDTVLAMIATDSGHPLNPAQMDDALTASHIFVKDLTGTYDLLPDNALAQAFPKDYSVTSYAGFRGDLIRSAVPSADTYAYAWISTPSVPTHFVLMASADGRYIADPWTGKIGELAGYGGPSAVHKTVLVKHIAPPKPVPPVAAPVPTPPPVNPAQGPAPIPPSPTPAPEPAPVPAPPAAVISPPAPDPTPAAPPAVTEPTTPTSSETQEGIFEDLRDIASDVAHHIDPAIPEADPGESLPDELGELARDVLEILKGGSK